MPKPRRLLDATAELTTTPPDDLTPTQSIAKIVSAEGKSLYNVALPSKQTLLVELAPQFRNKIWLKRGGYVLVDTASLSERENKLGGEIINVVRDEKTWRRMAWWPEEFPKQTAFADDDDSEEESTVGKMPPSDSDDD